jgi:hypothetical protein
MKKRHAGAGQDGRSRGPNAPSMQGVAALQCRTAGAPGTSIDMSLLCVGNPERPYAAEVFRQILSEVNESGSHFSSFHGI